MRWVGGFGWVYGADFDCDAFHGVFHGDLGKIGISICGWIDGPEMA